jgi:CubicO group peptidase (beta-lactamase class C family)
MWILAGRELLAQQPDGSTVPTGAWGAVNVMGPALRGPLTVVRTGRGTWTATVADSKAPGAVQDRQVGFQFADQQGHLELEARDNARTLRGFWRQPRGNVIGWFATPVTLAATGAGTYSGALAPLPDQFSLYLTMQQTDSGVRAMFHNPEAGWNGGRSWFLARRDSTTLEFLDPASGKVRQQQPYNPGTGAITMDFGTAFDLMPTRLDAATGLVPRPPSGPPYAYRVPVEYGDGWRSGSASSTGLDENLLAVLVDRIAATDVLQPTAPRIHSVLVARHGRLVLEEYFFGYLADRAHDIRSAGKTFTSLMAGIAIDRGHFTADTPVYPFLGAVPVGDDPRRRRIVLRHLLTHSTGLACDDNDEQSPGQEDRMYEQSAQPDWYRYALELPMAHEPGSAYAYCTAGINLTGAMIAKGSGSSTLEFFRSHVADPLDMRGWHMNLMPSGDAYAGGGAWLRPRDLLKLGQVFLSGGTWNGRRIVSQRWVDVSTRPHIDVPDGSADGYGWHIQPIQAHGRAWRMYYASGNGGQLVMVVPDLDLVVAFTAGNFNRYPIWRTFRDELLPAYIVRAATTGH